jgi:hypothetical protein
MLQSLKVASSFNLSPYFISHEYSPASPRFFPPDEALPAAGVQAYVAMFSNANAKPLRAGKFFASCTPVQSRECALALC